MSRHRNIALFVPHSGCPHQCSFCNQKIISGQSNALQPADVDKAARIAAESGSGGEIAFFGGSFTAIDREYMLRLLQAAEPYIKNGVFSGVRCSTRPDAIDAERLDILRAHGVTAVELGAQSMVDAVLALNERGHTAADTVRACEMIRAYGMELGLQMMTGLYGSDAEKDRRTAVEFVKLQPDTVRIYPTIVLEHTRLAQLYHCGDYRPQTLEEATVLCAELLQLFHRHEIAVIRLGLHSGGNVQEGFLAGPYHPAFRELCESRIYADILRRALLVRPSGSYRLGVAPSEISKLVGQKRANLEFLRAQGYACRVSPVESLAPYELQIEKTDNTQ